VTSGYQDFYKKFATLIRCIPFKSGALSQPSISEFSKSMNQISKLRANSSKRGIATVVVVLVVIVIILLAGIAYLAVAPAKTVSSIVTTVSTATASVSTAAPSTVTSTVTSTSIFSNPLLLYSADSQVNESGVLESAFTAQTGIPMATPVSAGSGALAADISAGDPVSVFLSISHSSVSNSDLGTEFPGWAIAFAGDQFDIAYSAATNQSTAGQAVLAAYATASATNTTGAWFDFFNNLTSGAVKVGISNPVADPAGYRGWLALELAGIAYDNNNSQYFVNRTTANNVNVTGASAAAMVPALQSGQIQFLFYYRSAIVSGGLDLLQLPEPVNLGEAIDNSFYGQASYTLPTEVETGSAITLCITVPADSTDPTDSVNFVVFVILNQATLLKSFDLTPFSPAHLYNTTGYTVPAPIVGLLNNGTLVDEGPVGS
jgi:molybdate/tungstate transport system substrate-binding protein